MKTRGFTLIQIAVLLTVASLVAVSVIPSYQKSSPVINNKDSVNKMNAIMEALRQYQATNSVLPCPADPTIAIGNSNYGVAAANPGTTNNCTGSSPAAKYTVTNTVGGTTYNIAIGMVPVKTLGLPNDYALDAYGRDITYMVDTSATGTSSGKPCISSSLPGAITVNDRGITRNTVAALVSYGADGYGAWIPIQGTGGSNTASRLDSGSRNTAAADNAEVAHGGGLTNNTTWASLINQTPTATFDDVVVFQHPQFSLNILPATYRNTTAYTSNCSNTWYYRTITIDYTKVPNTDQANFPVLISGTYSYLAYASSGGKAINSNSGYDVVFTSDAAGTNILNFERTLYNSATGQVNFWVKVPTVSHTANTVIYMKYGDSTITSDQANTAGTWDSNYVGVFHLDSDPPNSSVGLTSQVNHSATTGTGQIYGDFVFDGVNGSTSGIVATTATSNYTISAWLNPASTAGTQAAVCNGGYKYANDGSLNPFCQNSGYCIGIDSGKWKAIYDLNGSGMNPCGSPNIYTSNTNASSGAWTYVVMQVSGGTGRFYVNGSAVGSNFSPSVTSPAGWNGIGAQTGKNNGSYYAQRRFNGAVDEARISDSARSADWIKTEYNNQSSPSTFYTVGSEIAVSR